MLAGALIVTLRWARIAVDDEQVAPRAENLSEQTIHFYLEGLGSCRAYAGGADRDLTLADIDLDLAPRCG